jgi:predicted Zn-dependent peptidase
MSLDTPDKVAGGLARILALHPDIEALENLYRTMDTISPDDIMESAKYFFNPQKRTVVTLTGNK